VCALRFHTTPTPRARVRPPDRLTTSCSSAPCPQEDPSTRGRSQVSLGSPIQNPSPGSSGLLWHKGHFKPLLTQAPALAGYRSGGNLRGLCYPLVGPLICSISIGLEQDSSVEQLAGMSPATPQKLFDVLTLVCDKSDDILLVQDRISVGCSANKRAGISFTTRPICVRGLAAKSREGLVRRSVKQETLRKGRRTFEARFARSDP
jgi:hypothetical protein